MYKMGTLFGCAMFIDTDDEQIKNHVNNYWDKLQKDMFRLGEMEIELEMSKWKKGSR